jgi:hypothetical protein
MILVFFYAFVMILMQGWLFFVEKSLIEVRGQLMNFGVSFEMCLAP